MESKKTYKILSILLVLQWAAVQFIKQYPIFIEKYYSTGFYSIVSQVSRFLLGWIPFSIGDLLYASIIVLVITQIIVAIKHRRLNIKNTIFKIGGFCSVIYFLFHLNWGLNYYREPVISSFNKNDSGYTVDQLIGFSKKLVVKANKAHQKLAGNDSILIQYPMSKKDLRKIGPKAYEALQVKHPQFNYKIKSIKHSLFSLPLTYMGFAGYLNPLTNEAQVNYMIPESTYPATLCHEMAHQLGIASESEANFIGFLAATHADDPYFNYSGYTMALRYCINEVYKFDKEAFEDLMKGLNKGIIKDFKKNQDFWRSYQNKSEKHFKKAYDSYLKANNQKEGIKSYNNMVMLLLRYFEVESL